MRLRPAFLAVGVALCAGLPGLTVPAHAAPRTVHDYIVANTFVVGYTAKSAPRNAIKVKTGDWVKWTNLDRTAHDVTFTSLGQSRYLKGYNASGQLRFTRPGYYSFVCTIHASQATMRGLVYVSNTAPY